METNEQAILGYLERRWARPLDLSTIAQAQAALGLAPAVGERLRVMRKLEHEPGSWRRIARFGAVPADVALTPAEKLFARALAAGMDEDAAAAIGGLDTRGVRAARRALRGAGVPGHGPPRKAGVPRLLFHTVRPDGEPAFGVP